MSSFVRYLAAAVLLATASAVSGDGILFSSSSSFANTQTAVTLADKIDCTKYIGCRTELDLNGLNRDSYLQCFDLLGPQEVITDIENFKLVTINPTILDYTDVLNYECSLPEVGIKSLPRFLQRKASDQVGRSAEEQKKVNDYNACVNSLFQKCVTLRNQGAIVVEHVNAV